MPSKPSFSHSEVIEYVESESWDGMVVGEGGMVSVGGGERETTETAGSEIEVDGVEIMLSEGAELREYGLVHSAKCRVLDGQLATVLVVVTVTVTGSWLSPTIELAVRIKPSGRPCVGKTWRQDLCTRRKVIAVQYQNNKFVSHDHWVSLFDFTGRNSRETSGEKSSP